MEHKINTYAFFLLLIGITALFFKMTASFLIAVFWAIILTIVFYPLHTWIKKKVKNSRLAAACSLVIIAACLSIPSFFAGNLIVHEIKGIYSNLQTTTFESGKLRIAELANNYGPFKSLSTEINTLGAETVNITKSGIDLVSKNILWLGENIFQTLLFLFILIYTLFFLLKDGIRLRHTVIESLPFSDKHTHKLFDRFSSITRATLKGVFFVGIIEAIVASIAFHIAGVPSPTLWGLAIFFASIVPGLGTGIIWFPVVGYLVLSGLYLQAGVILAIGIATVVIVDNILRPRMVGRDTKLPDAFILISTFGGIGLFGASGILLGPLIAGFFVAAWEIFRTEYKQKRLSTEE